MRRATVQVAYELWKLCSLTPGHSITAVANDIPDDARVVGITYDDWPPTFVITIESDKLPDIPHPPYPVLTGPTFNVETVK